MYVGVTPQRAYPMRGDDQPQTTLFSFISIEDRIPADHPLRTIQALVNPILTALSPRFHTMYSHCQPQGGGGLRLRF